MISPKLKLPILCSFVIIVVIALLAPHVSNADATHNMWQQYTYSGPSGSRAYFVYTPNTYQVGTAVPLIVMLHGCGQTPIDFAASTQMNQLAEEYNFIVVYPQETSSNGCWNWFSSANQFRDRGEPAIIAGIVKAVEQNTSQWTIDPKHIYVAGFSAGAAMAGIMGVTYPDIFAAIGVHSGIEYQAATSINSSFKVMRQGGPDPIQQGQVAYDVMGSLAHVVPTIVFHGMRDGIVSPINSDQTVQQWMETDLLASNGVYNADFNNPNSVTPGQVLGGRSYTIYTWNDTKGNEVQAYWKINDMGHAWSGGSYGSSYSDPQGPNASLAMYTFFMNHPMSRG